MELNRHGRDQRPSFARSVLLYVGFLVMLAVIAMVNTACDGAGLHDGALSQAHAAARSETRDATPPSGDPSLPAAIEVLRTPAHAAPADAIAPTF
jgi:hypothetical protein